MTSPTPGPGRRPADEPTHPTPTRPVTPPAPVPVPPRPAPQRGHLPIAGPSLHDHVSSAYLLGTRMLVVLNRDYDIASAPSAEDDPTGLGYVEIRLMSAAADIRSALTMLEQIAAALDAARQVPSMPSSACLPGGSSNHLTPTSPGVSGGLPPGLVDAASGPTSGGTDGSGRVPPHPEAGASSDPRRRLSQRAPIGNGVTPGVGFTLPVMFWYLQVGAEFVASINAALARRSR